MLELRKKQEPFEKNVCIGCNELLLLVAELEIKSKDAVKVGRHATVLNARMLFSLCTTCTMVFTHNAFEVGRKIASGVNSGTLSSYEPYPETEEIEPGVYRHSFDFTKKSDES